jgi:hypothetical protein
MQKTADMENGQRWQEKWPLASRNGVMQLWTAERTKKTKASDHLIRSVTFGWADSSDPFSKPGCGQNPE